MMLSSLIFYFKENILEGMSQKSTDWESSSGFAGLTGYLGLIAIQSLFFSALLMEEYGFFLTYLFSKYSCLISFNDFGLRLHLLIRKS